MEDVLLLVEVHEVINLLKSSVSLPSSGEFRFRNIVDPFFNELEVLVLFVEIRVQESEHSSCSVPELLHATSHKIVSQGFGVSAEICTHLLECNQLFLAA